MSEVTRRAFPEWHGWKMASQPGKITTLSWPFNEATDYMIPIGACSTSAEVLDWIVRVAKESWATDNVLAGFVRAVDATLNLQENFCGLDNGG